MTALNWIETNDLIRSVKPTQYIIDGILEANTQGLFYGQPASFKSFGVLRLAHSVCSGNPFFGHDVLTKGKVLYVCGEGAEGISRRVMALEQELGSFENNLLVLDGMLAIDDPTALIGVTDSIKQRNPVLVIFDTFASLAEHSDENSNSDIGKALKGIRKACGNQTTTVIVHHSGKAKESGSRGASAFNGNSDFTIEFVRADMTSLNITIECRKMKDGEHFRAIHALAKPIELEGLIGQNGYPVTTLILADDPNPVATTKANKPKLTIEQDAIMQCLYDAMRNGVKPKPEISLKYSGVPDTVATWESWFELAKAKVVGDCPDDRTGKQKRKRRAEAAMEKLIELELVIQHDTQVWIPTGKQSNTALEQLAA